MAKPSTLKQLRPLLVPLVFFILWWGTPPLFKRFLSISFHEFQAPIWFASSAIRDIQSFWTLTSHSNEDLIDAGKKLNRLVASYEASQHQIESLRQEIAQLESLLKMDSKVGYTIIPARVARRNLGSWSQQIIIRAGTQQDLYPGLPVIFSGGVVGRVIEVYAYTSLVELITSPNFRMVASFEGDMRPTTYFGQANKPFTPAQGIVMHAPTDILAQSEQSLKLLSCSLGGVFPDGLYIGTVNQLEMDSQGLFQSGRVQLDPRLNSLKEVGILIPLPQE